MREKRDSIETEGDWLTTEQAANMLGLSRHTVASMVDENQLPGSYRNGTNGHRRIPKSAVDGFLESQRHKAVAS